MKKVFCILFFLSVYCAAGYSVKANPVVLDANVIPALEKVNGVNGKINISASHDVKVRYGYKKKKVRGIKVNLFVPSGERPLICVLYGEEKNPCPEIFYFTAFDFPNGKRGPPAV